MSGKVYKWMRACLTRQAVSEIIGSENQAESLKI